MLNQPITIGDFLGWPTAAPTHASAGHAAAARMSVRREGRPTPIPAFLLCCFHGRSGDLNGFITRSPSQPATESIAGS